MKYYIKYIKYCMYIEKIVYVYISLPSVQGLISGSTGGHACDINATLKRCENHYGYVTNEKTR